MTTGNGRIKISLSDALKLGGLIAGIAGWGAIQGFHTAALIKSLNRVEARLGSIDSTMSAAPMIFQSRAEAMQVLSNFALVHERLRMTDSIMLDRLEQHIRKE